MSPPAFCSFSRLPEFGKPQVRSKERFTVNCYVQRYSILSWVKQETNKLLSQYKNSSFSSFFFKFVTWVLSFSTDYMELPHQY